MQTSDAILVTTASRFGPSSRGAAVSCRPAQRQPARPSARADRTELLWYARTLRRPSWWTCIYTPLSEGTPCNDKNGCTTGACQAGVCLGDGITDGFIDLTPGETKTFTCPSDPQAEAGIAQPTTCLFPRSFVPNLIFTGPVPLISHLSRDWAGYDISTLSSGDPQIACVYEDSDGSQVGGTYGITNAASCTATDTSFICTK